jgi:NAD(P)-dependent dehydrogenase (short-subunit alcohol dehydrogenase family)
MAEFTGKVALVTGAASGIGRAVAIGYAREGAKVVVSDIDEKGGEETVRLVKETGSDAAFIKTDVSDPKQVEDLVRSCVSTFGGLHLACNNAGIGGESNSTADYSIDGWHKVININLNSVFYCLKYEIPAITNSGGGAIVNMASILGQVAFSHAPAYVAAKHGVVGLTQTAAVEFAASGVRVNSIGPGFIQTPMISALEQDRQMNDMLVSLHPIGRLGKPEEVADAVIWLCSSKSTFVVGAYIEVDGGYLAR